MTTKVIIDGSNMWYRAYMATMLDPPGGPVMIMTNMLRKLCDRFGKTNIIVCWDAGDGGRKILDKDYKSQRTSRPQLWEDSKYMKEMLTCLGISYAQKDGYEADDVIASLAVKEDASIVVSYDKDFYQLVNDNIKILQPARNVYGKEISEKMVDRDIVMEEFGCQPSKVLLLKAFKGDKSDNIPKLQITFNKNFKNQFFTVITKSNNLEDFYKNISYMDKKYQEKLLEFKERSFLNMKLIAFHLNLDIQINKSRLDAVAFESLCKKLEINRLRIATWEAIPEEAAPLPPVQGSLF